MIETPAARPACSPVAAWLEGLPPLGATESQELAGTAVGWRLSVPGQPFVWYATEGESLAGKAPDGGDDALFFGLADLGRGCPELGYFLGSEIAAWLASCGLQPELDRTAGRTLAEVMRLHGRTVDETES